MKRAKIGAQIRRCLGNKDQIVALLISTLSNISSEDQAYHLFNQWQATYQSRHGTSFVSNLNELMPTNTNMVDENLEVVDPWIYFFSLHTYYSVLTSIVSYYYLLKPIHPLTCEKKVFQAILDGSWLSALGVNNFLAGDLFSWFLSHWHINLDEMSQLVLNQAWVIVKIAINHNTPLAWLFTNLFNFLFPPTLRHDLGEYYTPPWLVRLAVEEAGYKGQNNSRVLDPSCGAGAFLHETIRVYKECNKRKSQTEQLEEITRNIVGLDINPTAVQASRFVYLSSIVELTQEVKGREIEIPVLHFDSLVEIADKDVLSDHFDFILGNPPWVKWDFLTPQYKKHLTNLVLDKYELFAFQGQDSRHGFAHDDLSVVFTYVTADRFLRRGGTLSFVLKQTLLQNEAGRAFRRFEIRKSKTKTLLNVRKVIDLVQVEPFKPYGAETCVVVLTKGSPTSYPISYLQWIHQNPQKKAQPYHSLDEVHELVKVNHLLAFPDPSDDDPLAPWVISETEHIPPAILGEGSNHYKPRHGVVNDLVSVFFVNILGRENDKLLLVENSRKTSKKTKKVPDIKTTIEPDLIFPCVKSRHVKKWTIIGYDYLLVPQTKAGKVESRLETQTPLTYQYLTTYKEHLLNRSSVHFKDKPFYSVYSVGPYTFLPYKVIWCSMHKEPMFAVAKPLHDKYLGQRVIIPDNPMSYIALNDLEEANFVCGILNSRLLANYFSAKGRGTKYPISQKVVSGVPIPKFNPEQQLHSTIAQLSQTIHQHVVDGLEMTGLEEELEKVVQELLLPQAELRS